MEKFKKLKSIAIPLPIVNIDTDMIIPANFMTSVSRDGYAENVFRRLRDNDENFPFNLDKFKNAQIIVAEDNFGCGSSREHAVWALVGFGIRAIIAPSFADIFASNSAKNGLVLIQQEKRIVKELLNLLEKQDLEIEVDLDQQKFTYNNNSLSFDYDSFSKHCILNGLDDIDYILSHDEQVEKYNQKRKNNIFFSSTYSNR